MRAICCALFVVATAGAQQPLPEFGFDQPPFVLEHLGTVTLQSTAPNRPPIRDVDDFDIDDRGRIGVYRRHRVDEATFVLVGADGGILREIPVSAEISHGLAIPEVRYVGRDRWAIASTHSRPAGAWWIDVSASEITAVDGFTGDGPLSIAGDAAGGFVMFQSLERRELAAFDASGKERWRIDDEGAGVRLPFSASVTVTTNSEIVLLDQNDQTLQMFSLDGKYSRSIDSDATRYCAPGAQQLARDVGGGVVINDAYGSPTIRRASLRQTQKQDVDSGFHLLLRRGPHYAYSEFKPRYANGRVFAPYRGVRVDPNGRLWASDGQAILRLDDAGVVDLIIGEPESDETLPDVSAGFVDSGGRTYLLSRRSGAVHVFDASGERLHICHPAPTDFEGNLFSNMAVTGEGVVVVWDGHTRYLRFSPDGERLGFDKLGLDWVNGRPHFQPRDARIWITHDREFHLADAAGKRLRTIRARPDGEPLNWLCSAAVAPDGSIAVVADARRASDEQRSDGSQYTVNTYSAEGDPLRTFPVPAGLSPVGPTFDGRYVVFRNPPRPGLSALSTVDGTVRRVSVEQPATLEAGRPYFVGGGRELWFLDDSTRHIERFGYAEVE